MDGAVAGAGSLQADQSNHARGHLAMHWRQVAGRTRLATVAQEAPYRLLTPMVEPYEPPLAVAANVSGGVVGGDWLDLSLAVGPNATLSTVGQAAEKVYRSAGPTAHLRNRISVEGGGTLDWMPQGTILFDGVRMTRRTMRPCFTARFLSLAVMAWASAWSPATSPTIWTSRWPAIGSSPIVFDCRMAWRRWPIGLRLMAPRPPRW